MQSGSIARRYARGVFELAREEGVLDTLARDLEGFEARLASSHELKLLFSSPTYGADAQVEILRSLLSARVHRLSLNFLMLLAQRHRMALHSDIIREFKTLRDLEEGIVRVKLTSASALPSEIEAALLARLSEMVGKRIAVTSEIDPSLIGGLITQVGHVVFDGSLATQFSKIKRHLEQGEGR